MSDINAAVADLEDDDDNDDDDDEEENSGAAISEKPYMLSANGDLYDLRDSDQVNTLQESMKSYRNDLINGELKTYEGHSTEFGKGGRARLLYDTERSNLAEEYHEGRHNMSWSEQSQEAMKVVRIVAIRNRNLY